MSGKSTNKTSSEYMACYREMWDWTVTNIDSGELVHSYKGNKYNDESCRLFLLDSGADINNVTRGSDESSVIIDQFLVRRVLCTQ
jgi:hypothetical protein